MSWIQTYSGSRFDICDPYKYEMRIEDIAHALSNLCRFTGHTREFYSVAQHCIHVSALCPPKYALWGLLHDATEAYINDLATPVKSQLSEYRKFESRIGEAVVRNFNLNPEEMPYEVKYADRIMLHREMKDLMPGVPIGVDDYLGNIWLLPLQPLPPAKARVLFLTTYNRLAGK